VLLGVADEYLHLGSSWVFNCVKVATAPLVLLMHATVPAVTPGARLPLATPCIRSMPCLAICRLPERCCCCCC